MSTLPAAKLLYRRLDSLVGALDPGKPQKKPLLAFLEDGFRILKADLRLKAVALYAEQGDSFSLLRQAGDPGGPLAETLEPACLPLTLVFQQRVYLFGDPTAEASPARLGLLPHGPSAALVIGRRPTRYLLVALMPGGRRRRTRCISGRPIRSPRPRRTSRSKATMRRSRRPARRRCCRTTRKSCGRRSSSAAPPTR